MAAIDIDKLLEAVSPDALCGEDVEYDPAFPAFREMEEAARPKPPPEFGPDKNKPPEPPDWRKVQQKALEVLARSKHLRPAVYLSRALLDSGGFSGFEEGLRLLKGLLEGYWETLYPPLDPADPTDPARRNILDELNSPEFILSAIRRTPLLDLPQLGRFSLRDIKIADKAVKLPVGPEKQLTELAVITAELIEKREEAEGIQATAGKVRDAIAAVCGCIEHVDAIQTDITARTGAENAPRLADLKKVLEDAENVLQQIDTTLAEQLLRHGIGVPPPAEAEPAVAAAAAPGARPAATPLTGEISNREDVIRWLDKICEYYKQHEPSSPVPLLLQRAKRLVSKDFIDILRDLAPNGLPQVEVLRGIDSEQSSHR